MKPYVILFAGRARRELARADEWWNVNRPDAPGLLVEELTAALAKLADAPYTGVAVKHPREVRRWLLHRCRYHVYYSIDDQARSVTVRALWHALRGQGPRLK